MKKRAGVKRSLKKCPTVTSQEDFNKFYSGTFSFENGRLCICMTTQIPLQPVYISGVPPTENFSLKNLSTKGKKYIKEIQAINNAVKRELKK